MLEAIAFAVLVLTNTGIFIFLAPQVGTTIELITVTLGGFLGIYIIAKRDVALSVLRHKSILIHIIFLAIWPISTLLYTDGVEYRSLGLKLYYLILFFATIVYALSSDRDRKSVV